MVHLVMFLSKSQKDSQLILNERGEFSVIIVNKNWRKV